MALLCNANGESISHGSAAMLDDLSTWSMYMWVYLQSPGNPTIPFCKGTFILRIQNAGDGTALAAMRARAGAQDWRTSNNGVLVNNAWNCIVVTYDSSRTNGFEIWWGDLDTAIAEVGYSYNENGSGALTTDAAENLMWGDISGGGYNFAGDYAVVQFYDVVLTNGQIRALQYWPRTPTGDCLVHCDYGFNGTGTQPDHSGNGNDGTLNGSPTVSPHVPLRIARGVDAPYVVSGAQTVSLDALALSGAAQTLNVSPGAVALALDTLALAGAAGTLSVLPGAVSVALDSLTLAGLAQTLGVSPGAVSVALDALGLTGTAQGLTVGTGILVALNALGLTGSAQSLAVAPGAVQVALDALGLSGTAQSTSVLAGAVQVALNALTLAGAAGTLTVDAGIRIALDALTLSGSARALSVAPGATSVALDALSLVAATLALTVAAGMGLIDVEVSDALVWTVTLSDALVASVRASDALVGDVHVGDTSRT